ncbi:hypothetical protein HZS_7492, partial [Henneguya salminicola]
MSSSDFWTKEESSLKEIGLEFDNKNNAAVELNECSNNTDEEKMSHIYPADVSPQHIKNEKIQEWENERNAEIAKINSQQVEKEAEMRRAAAEELSKWFKERDKLIEKRKKEAKTTMDTPISAESTQTWNSALTYWRTDFLCLFQISLLLLGQRPDINVIIAFLLQMFAYFLLYSRFSDKRYSFSAEHKKDCIPYISALADDPPVGPWFEFLMFLSILLCILYGDNIALCPMAERFYQLERYSINENINFIALLLGLITLFTINTALVFP